MGGGSLLTPILVIVFGFLCLGLALVLSLSGLKLLEVPQANWIIAGGLGAGAVAHVTYAVRTWLARPRAAPAGSFD